MKKSLFAAVTILAFSLGGCSSAPTVKADKDELGAEKKGQSSGGDGGPSSENADGGVRGLSAGGNGEVLVRDQDEGDGGGCETVTCEELDAECGVVDLSSKDYCEQFLDCGECGDGEECGLKTPYQCDSQADLCTPIPKEEACADKECGAVGDGCGSTTYDCGECGDGEACGVEKPFQCGPASDGASGTCVAAVTSCEEAGVECGQIGDGCGGVIDCDEETGGCDSGSVCGLDAPGVCSTACVPLTPEVACEGKCGIVSNGCGADVDNGLIDCSTIEAYQCPQGTACGAGGVANQCGTAEGSCVPVAEEVACANRECGVVSDGCEASYTCGACDAQTICRDGACEAICTPTPQADACMDKECGLVSDGCGDTYSCGDCADGSACGLLTAFVCDVVPPTVCVPMTAAEACLGRECGSVYDGCGTDVANIIDCAAYTGGCPDGELCGIVQSFQCDPPPTPTCTPAESCAALGYECGYAIDECGNVLDCSLEGLTCDAATETCSGGINGPTQCVGGTGGGAPANCDVCDAIPDCSGQAQETQLSGRVITPGRNDTDTANQVGVPNAFVYILRNNDAAELPDFGSGIPYDGSAYGTSCDRCDEQDLGPVLASATTDPLGNFVIEGNIPVDQEFVLVVKIGKWRRAVQVTVPGAGACQTTSLDVGNTRLPRSQSDGLMANIPRIAVSTGQIDAMECVFSKMGVADAEFSLPGTDGSASPRIHMYRDNDTGGGASMPDGSVDDEVLHTDIDRVMLYDMLVFDCEGPGYAGPDDTDDNTTSDPIIREYVNRGGRMFASHLSYTWIYDNGSQAYDAQDPYNTGLIASATWQSSGYPDTGTAIVSTDRPGANASKIQNFADWLVNENAATLGGDGRYTFPVVDPRDLAASVGTYSEEFVYREDGTNSTSVQQYSFNTPYGAPDDAICGRVAYSGFHVVAGASGFNPYGSAVFPDHCAGDLTDQEKVLLFMLFDLGACVTTDVPEPPACTPVGDCTGRCGAIPDGCGGTLVCGDCASGEVCLAGGVCGTLECIPTTCPAEGATCGFITDGCGGILNCGDCPTGQECGLFAANQCGLTCTPVDEQTACDGACGFVSDNCGGVYECPDCTGGLSCVSGMCVSGGCDPLTVCPPELECGVISDGCAGTLNCGACALPDVCGGGGQANVCGVPQCEPLTCEALTAECGWVGNGCGGALDCGDCPMGQVCGAGGPNTCGGCQPLTCAAAGAECGAIGNGCGGVVQCGDCPQGQTCGATEANKCGSGPSCSPMDCESLNAECGVIGDGCGDTVDCGDCPAGEVCGIDTAFQCGAPPACSPTTCEAEGAECGALGDKCGGLLDCGPCAAGFTCGLNSPNKCGSVGAPK